MRTLPDLLHLLVVLHGGRGGQRSLAEERYSVDGSLLSRSRSGALLSGRGAAVECVGGERSQWSMGVVSGLVPSA